LIENQTIRLFGVMRAEADLRMFSMFDLTGAPQNGTHTGQSRPMSDSSTIFSGSVEPLCDVLRHATFKA